MPKYTKRKDGRYEKKITTKEGKRITFYGKTEKELFQNIMEYEKKLEFGELFKDVAWEWWDEAEQELSYQTKGSYKVALKEAIEYFNETYIKEIKPKHINEYINTFVKKGYAQKTISNKKMVLNRIFEYAVIKDYIEYNPCASVKLPKNLPKSKRPPATPEEEKIILQSSDMWVFPYIALLAGLRRGEILALQWKDIDFENKIISVTKSIYYEGNKACIKEPKTKAGTRIVPLLDTLYNILLPLKSNSEHFIVCNEDGSPISKKKFRYQYNKFRKETGIEASAHQLRHSFATIAFESGVQDKAVQEILGHKQLSTTMDIYTAFRKKSFDEVVDKMNKNMK